MSSNLRYYVTIPLQAALGIWKTVFAFMQNVQAAPRFRYQGQSRVSNIGCLILFVPGFFVI